MLLNRAFALPSQVVCFRRILAVDYSTRVTNTMGATEQMNISSRNSNRDSMHNKGTMSRAAHSRDDRRVAVYDRSGSVNLNAGMQTTVPKPFKRTHSDKPTHQHHSDNVAGNANAKLLSNSIKQTHQNRNFATFSPNGKLNYVACSKTKNNHVLFTASSRLISKVDGVPVRCMSSSEGGEVKVSQRERLKKAVKEYGATVIIFHVSISLVSLGSFYLAVSRFVYNTYVSYSRPWPPPCGNDSN